MTMVPAGSSGQILLTYTGVDNESTANPNRYRIVKNFVEFAAGSYPSSILGPGFGLSGPDEFVAGGLHQNITVTIAIPMDTPVGSYGVFLRSRAFVSGAPFSFYTFQGGTSSLVVTAYEPGNPSNLPNNPVPPDPIPGSPPPKPNKPTKPYYCEGNQITAIWDSVMGATFYQVYVDDALFTTTTSNMAVIAKPIGSLHSVYIVAGNTYGLSPASDILYFIPCSTTTFPPPPVPNPGESQTCGLVGTWNKNCD